MRTLAIPLIVAVVFTACKDAASPEPIDVSGRWGYTEAFGVNSIGLSCSNTGTLQLEQIGEALTGSYQQQGHCAAGSMVFDNSGSGPVTSGEVDGGSVALEMGDCSYSGTIAGPLANRLYGTIQCDIEVDGQQHTANGSWEALR